MIRLHRFAVAGVLGVLGVASTMAQANPPTVDLPGVLPPDISTDLVVLTPEGQRAYYVNATGDVWLFDRVQKTGARITGGHPWDLAVSPTRDALVYTRAGDRPTQQNVWVSPLDPKTGLAKGSERRLSASRGDVPSVSPDGKRVALARDDATGVGQSIIVVPIAGGPEQVVVPSVPSSIDYIRWAPDGASLYFAVNPPVPCVPDWSCLPLPSSTGRDQNLLSIRRAPVAGGVGSVVVASVRSAWPGLSPDGTVLAYGDASNARRMTVTDAGGQVLGGFTLATNQTVSGWLGGANLLLRAAGNIRRLQVTSLAGGPSHAAFESPDRLTTPVWSPDGTRLAAVRCSGTAPCELRVLNADGSPHHALTLAETSVTGLAWSPDARWVSYTGAPANQAPHLVAIELATDHVVPLGDMRQSVPGFVLWTPDSEHLVVTDQSGSGAARTMSFRLVAVNGSSTRLREVPVGDPPGYAMPIDASTALVSRTASRDVRLVSLSDESPERVLLTNVELFAAPVVSSDRQWLAVRRSADPLDATGLNVIELCRVDGSARTTTVLPFRMAPGAASLAILPGAQAFLVAEAWGPTADPGVYLVPVAAKDLRKLFTYPSRPGRSGPPDLAMSADGHTVAAAMWDGMTPSFTTIDLSAFRRPGRER